MNQPNQGSYRPSMPPQAPENNPAVLVSNVAALLQTPFFQQLAGNPAELQRYQRAAAALNSYQGRIPATRESSEQLMNLLRFLQDIEQKLPDQSPFKVQVRQLLAQFQGFFSQYRRHFAQSGTIALETQSPSPDNLQHRAQQQLRSFHEQYQAVFRLPADQQITAAGQFQQSWIKHFQVLLQQEPQTFSALLDILLRSSSSPAKQECIRLLMQLFQNGQSRPNGRLGQQLEQLRQQVLEQSSPHSGLQHSQVGEAQQQTKEYALHDAPPEIKEPFDMMLAERPPKRFVERFLAPALASKYTQVSYLAQGGMGAIIRAYEENLGRWVALKFNTVSADPDLVEGFLREGKSAASIGTNANIVAVHAAENAVIPAGDARIKIPYIAFEFIEGGKDMKYLLDVSKKARRPLPVEAVMLVIKQAAQGLAAAHRTATIHRDIKLDNILVPQDLQAAFETWIVDKDDSKLVTSVRRSSGVKIGDFGLAGKRPDPEDIKQAEGTADQHTLTAGGKIVGTPMYLPPESLDPAAAGKPWDVYDLGLVFYMVATAYQYPLEFSKGVKKTDTVFSIVDKVLNKNPQSPSVAGADKDPHIRKLMQRNAKHNPAVIELMQAMTGMDPAQRPSMDEIIERIEGLLQQRSKIAQRAADMESEAKQAKLRGMRERQKARRAREQAQSASRTKKRLAIAFGALLGAGALGGIGSAIMSRREHSANLAALRDKIDAFDGDLGDGFAVSDQLDKVDEARSFLLEHFSKADIAENATLSTLQERLDQQQATAELLRFRKEKLVVLDRHQKQQNWSAILTECENITEHLDSRSPEDTDLDRAAVSSLRELVQKRRDEAREQQRLAAEARERLEAQLRQAREQLAGVQRLMDQGKGDDALARVNTILERDDFPASLRSETIEKRTAIQYQRTLHAYHWGQISTMESALEQLQRDEFAGLSRDQRSHLEQFQSRTEQWTVGRTAAHEVAAYLSCHWQFAQNGQILPTQTESQRRDVVRRWAQPDHGGLTLTLPTLDRATHLPTSAEVRSGICCEHMRATRQAFNGALQQALQGDIDQLHQVLEMYMQVHRAINTRLRGLSGRQATESVQNSPEVIHLGMMQQTLAVQFSQQGWNLRQHVDLAPGQMRLMQRTYRSIFTYFKDLLHSYSTGLNPASADQVANQRYQVAYLMFQAAGNLIPLIKTDNCLTDEEDTSLSATVQMLTQTWRSQARVHFTQAQVRQFQQVLIQNNPHLQQIPEIMTALESE